MNAFNRNPVLRKMLTAMAIVGSLISFTARAGSWDFGDLKADYTLTLNYGLAIRMLNPNQALINGPVDLFQLNLAQATQGGAFTHTGLPTTVNEDDGDRNFAKGSAINNRLSALAEFHLTYKNYGLVVSEDGFYDRVYHEANANNSPDTVNKTGPSNQFSPAARHYDGQRARLDDAYVYGDWTIGDSTMLDARVGNQLIAWGESLFFPGVSSAQSTADATKAFTPGVEVKEILLPTNQISMNLAFGSDWNAMAYYKLAFKPNELFPVGDYLSPTDTIGPGAQFAYGAVNPLYLSSCPGLLGSLSSLCQLGGGAGGPLLGAPPYILIPYDGVMPVSRHGQYGTGLKYQITPQTNLSIYALRYTDPNPSVVQHSGYPQISSTPVLTTQEFDEPTANSYSVKYFDGIRMLAGSYSTVLGPVNVAGEVSYRDKASVAVQAIELGTTDPVFTHGGLVQALTSAIYATNPHFWYDDLALVGEVGYVHVTSVQPAQSQPGIVVVGNGETLFYDRNAWGFQALATPTKRNVFQGWDLTTPVTFGWLVKGNPSMPGAFGSLYGEGDRRISIMTNFQYQQNLQIGIGYNMFFGNVNKNIGSSFLKQNPYTDRDYMTINVKYSL